MEEKDREDMYPIIEALLFTWGDSLSEKDIADVLSVTIKEVKTIMDSFISHYNGQKRGLLIKKFNDSYQIGTRPKYYTYLKRLNKPISGRNLSNAALETLAIIAYKQPTIKSELEKIRGVKCDTAIYTLLDKELIEERGRLDTIGRPILYGTTDEFLRVFGLEGLEDLPELEDFFKIDNSTEEEVVDK